MILKNTCTLITAFYNFKEKKHSTNKYLEWMENFISNCDNYMVIYTNDKETRDIIYNMRINFLDKTLIIIKPIENFYTYRYIDKWNKNLLIDHERNYHNINLYMIWNEKTMFMYETSIENKFNTEFFAWCDIGMVRHKKEINLIKDYPSQNNLVFLRRDKVYLLEVEKFLFEELFLSIPSENFKYKNRCGGGFIICSHFMIERWKNEYYNMLDLFMNNNLFAGKDQSIMNNLYIKYKEELIYLIEPKNSPIDDWFYMLYYLSKYYKE